MKYWNGSCWKDHHESTRVDIVSAEYGGAIEPTAQELRDAKPIGLYDRLVDQHEEARRIAAACSVPAELLFEAKPRERAQYDRQTLGRYVPRCDFGDCIHEKGHEGNHVDGKGNRIRVDIAPRTEAQRAGRQIGPIRIAVAGMHAATCSKASDHSKRCDCELACNYEDD